MAEKISKEEFERRDTGVNRLCAVLGTTRAFICDPILTMVMGIPSVDPFHIEQWLKRIGKGVGADESLYDALEKHYGKEIADLAKSLC